MTALDEATAVEGSDGRYTATLSPVYRTFVAPFGAYVAAVMLRAAGAHSSLRRPVSMYCQFLNAAESDAVELGVITQRGSSRAEALRVAMSQNGKHIAETLVWMVGDIEGLDHAHHRMPTAPSPESLLTFQELYAGYPEGFAFMEGRPIFEWPLDKPRPGKPPWPVQELFERLEPLPPFVRGWVRLRPTPTFEDPIVDAARSLLPLDWFPIGAAQQPHVGTPVFLPSLDLSVSFHDSAPESEWLYCEAESAIGLGGVVNASGKVWSQDGRLLASGVQQAFQRVMPMDRFLTRE